MYFPPCLWHMFEVWMYFELLAKIGLRTELLTFRVPHKVKCTIIEEFINIMSRPETIKRYMEVQM